MDQLRGALALEACLERLAAGDTIATCLAAYPDQAADLAPVLATAARLQTMAGQRLADSQRRQAQATLAAAMARQRRQSAQRSAPNPAPWWTPAAWLGRTRGFALAGMLAATLFVGLTVTAIAASDPGQAAYPLRVIVERVPVLLRASADGKATEELRIADRRLADVNHYLAATGQLEQAAVDALLDGDEAAALRAAALSETDRGAIAARVTAHAHALADLAEAAAETPTSVTLRAAAVQALAIAASLQTGPAQPAAPPGARPTATPAPTLTVTSTATAPALDPTEAPAPRPTTAPPRPSPTAGPTATAAGVGPGRRATALALTPTAQPTATATPNHAASLPTGTTEAPRATPAPGRRATALAQTATPTPTDTLPTPTTPGTPAPGRRATAIAQTATAAAPTATPDGSAPTPNGPSADSALTATPAPAETPAGQTAPAPGGAGGRDH